MDRADFFCYFNICTLYDFSFFKSFLTHHVCIYDISNKLGSQIWISLIFCVSLFLQSAWIAIKRNVEYKPLQFMSFAFVYRIFEKLKSFEAPSSPVYNVSIEICFEVLYFNVCTPGSSSSQSWWALMFDTGCRKKAKKVDGDWEWERGFFVHFH